MVVELPGWQLHVAGTAILIAGHLALTAGHVLDTVVRRFGSSCELVLYQVLPGPAYRVWNVLRAWRCPTTDIAFLHLASTARNYGASDSLVDWKTFRLTASAPSPGETVVAFGYREGQIRVTEGAEGVHHVELNDVGTTAIGRVGHVFPERRDIAMLTFPCFEVYAPFFPGMSGGFVMNGNGYVCGLICAGYIFEDKKAPPLSYATTLWPMLATRISADRGGKYPRGVSYPVIDLAIDGLIHVVGLEDLDSKYFPGRVPPRG
ncbi:MAG: S1 family peptidase [Candidatus Acidiferrales bacterium]